jgi:hypothetical protein
MVVGKGGAVGDVSSIVNLTVFSFASSTLPESDALLLEEQNGFRKGRSCMDCIFSASQIIEKHREFNIPTYIAFIDLKKK